MKYKFTHSYRIGDRLYHAGEDVPGEADLDTLLGLGYVVEKRGQKPKTSKPKKEISMDIDKAVTNGDR